MLKIIFLGTNGWYDTVTGNTIAILIETSSHFIPVTAFIKLTSLSKPKSRSTFFSVIFTWTILQDCTY